VSQISISAQLKVIADQVRALSAEDVHSWTPQTRAECLAGLQSVVDAANAQMLPVVAASDVAGDAELLAGARSTAAWLKHSLRWSGRDAAGVVRAARGLRDGLLSGAADELAEGRMSLQHVREIGRAVGALPAPAQEPAARILTEAAKSLAVDDLGRLGRQVRHMVDPDGAMASHDDNYLRRRLHMSELLDGMVALDGLLDAEAAATLNAALAPFLVPTSDDARTTPQRRADGLTELARLALDTASVAELGKEQPHLTLLSAAELPASHLRVASTAGKSTFLASSGTSLPGEPVPPQVVHRLSCDSTVRLSLLGQQGEVLFLGRRQRLFSPSQRHAMAIRDGGCRFPGCGMPAAFTDAHHIVSWREGGPSDVTNGLLLCRFHHRRVHEGSWTIRSDTAAPPDANATVWFAPPRGAPVRASLADCSRQRATTWLTLWASPP